MAANLTGNIGLSDIQSDSQFICKMHLDEIGPEAFKNASTLTSIEIYSAREIQANTLSGCTNLRRLILPGIENYSSNVFGTTSKLGIEYLQILERTQNIGTMLSSISSYIDLNLPTTLTSLEPSALYGVTCDKVKLSPTAVLCSNSLIDATVDYLYFNPAKSSKSLNLRSCENINTVFCIKNSTSYTLDTQLSGCKAYQIVFQSRGTGINKIQPSAFYNCENISYIDLHNSSLLTLPTHAFLNCRSLLSVFLPTSLTSIQSNAFEGCNGLRNYKLNIDGVSHIDGYIGYNAYFQSVPNTLTSVGDSAFRDARFDSSSVSLNMDELSSNLFMMTNTANRSNVTSITLKHNFSSFIPYQCFKNQTQLISISNTNKVDYIQSNAFQNDSSLRYINISSAISIAESAFDGCTSLSAIDMRNVETIQKWAFKDCINLTKDHIDSDDIGGVNTIQLFVNNSQNIGDEAFKNSGLQHISIGSKFISSDSSIGSDIFKGCNNLTHISVDLTYRQFAGKLDIDDEYIEQVELNRSDKTIVANACKRLYEKFFGTDFISQPNFTIQCKDISITKTGEGNDLMCLKYADPSTKTILSCVDVTASDYITFYLNPTLLASTCEVRANTFSQALTSTTSSLTSITMPEVTRCYPGILSGSSHLQYVVANRLTSIENHMLANDVALTSVEARSASSIGNYALCGCTSLTNTDGLVSLTSIGEYGFAYCNRLADIETLETSLKQAKNYSFKSCTSLTRFSSATLTSIGQSAFEDCTSLTSFSSTTLTSIGQSAFKSCISLTSFSSTTLTSIGQRAFEDCISLTSFSAPLASINSYVFNGCSKLKTINLVNSTLTSIPSNAFGNTQQLTSIQFSHTIESLGLSSLSCSRPNNLNVTLNGKTRTDANILTLLKPNNECGSPTGTLFFTDDSTYPSFITLSSNNIIKVASEKINVNRSGQLIGIDISLKSIDSYMLANLTGIQNTALNGSLCQSIYLPTEWSSWSDLRSKIENKAFNKTNSPNLIEIILVDKSISDGDMSNILEFYESKTESNDNITIRFSNAIFDGTNIIYTSDPFTFEYTDRKYIITGVKDEIMSTSKSLSNGHVDMIPNRYSAISSYAFADTKILSSIGHFNNITCIMSYAFTYNTSISSIYVAHNVGSNMDIQNNAFLNSSIKYAKLDNKLLNSSTTGLSGYGLNNTMKFNTLEYETGVTKIAPSAMIDYICDLSCIILPTTLESIGDYAFAKTIDRFPRIKNVNLQDMASLTSIGKYSFYNSIRSMPDNTLKFNKKLKKIDDAAFAYRWESYIDEISGLSSQSQYDPMTIATENVQTIGMSAFMFNKLKNVEFGNKIQTISSYAFAYPKYKFDVNIPASIRHIGENAFYKNVILNPNNIKKNVISVQCDISSFPSIFNITINEMDYADNKAGFTDATVISATHSANKYNAFAYIHNNKMMFCPSNLSIDLLNQSILSCETSSTSAYLQPYVEKIGSSAFYGCINLQSLSVHQNVLSGKVINIDKYAFYNCSSLTHIKNLDDPTNHVMNLNNVNDYSFYGCEQLSNVKLLSTTNYIGDYAFAKCKNLTSMHENDILSEIQFWTLSGIGEYAFASCDSLTSFHIPRSISAMGYHMFDSCPLLNNIYINIDSNRFLEIVGEYDIGHAVSSMFNGINDDGSCYINFLDIIYMNNGIVKIDNEYVNTYNNDGKTYISSLNYEKLYNDNKTYLNLSSIDGIDPFVFSNCLQLESISFLDNDTEHLDFIGDYAFNGCANLINFNNGKFNGTYIGMYAFSNCNNLLTFEIDYSNIDDDIQFDQGAFFGTSLNNIYITNVPSVTNEVLEKIKKSFGFIHHTNPNPLQLPEYCVIHLLDNVNKEIGRYDFMFNNLLGSTIDINRNALVFSDKSTDSIRPLAIVRQVDDTCLPALVTNTFHMNIIGRWK